MERRTLLIELGCEEIPARMIDGAVDELCRRLLGVLDRADLAYGEAETWGGTRRLAVRVGAVQVRQPDREEEVTGPPASVGFDADGQPTRAAVGFAKKQGIAPEDLRRVATDRGEYLGLTRSVEGRTVGEVLAADLPGEIAGMPFPKSMRWAAGRHRFVRPLHWVVALLDGDVLPLEIFGVQAGRRSTAHRFLSEGPVDIADAAQYVAALRAGNVWVDPAERRKALSEALDREAAAVGGRVVRDDALLAEIGHLVELPGVVRGDFDEAFLDLPDELLITTLRHHQKCFSVDDGKGTLRPHFLAVANTDRDPAGHVKRGNEWVVSGRLEDARFFWNEDRKRALADRLERLDGVVQHARIGSYLEKSGRLEALARRVGEALGASAEAVDAAARAGVLAKVDLVTGTVGEFPELQGQIGGLLLRAEGSPGAVADAVYAHYRPEGPDDPVPDTLEGAIVALADKLDSVHAFVSHVERPTGSRDPFGLRRATNGIFRIVVERRLPLSLEHLFALVDGHAETSEFLRERLSNYLRERGAAVGEIRSILRGSRAEGWPLPEVVDRLDAISRVRERADFERLVDLTKRVDNILTKNADLLARVDAVDGFDETEPAALELGASIEQIAPQIEAAASGKRFDDIVAGLARFVAPVDRFFEEVLVIDREQPAATGSRGRLLAQLRDVLTADYDIRELAGEAERRN